MPKATAYEGLLIGKFRVSYDSPRISFFARSSLSVTGEDYLLCNLQIEVLIGGKGFIVEGADSSD